MKSEDLPAQGLSSIFGVHFLELKLNLYRTGSYRAQNLHQSAMYNKFYKGVFFHLELKRKLSTSVELTRHSLIRKNKKTALIFNVAKGGNLIKLNKIIWFY